jgi:hypothetical protein
MQWLAVDKRSSEVVVQEAGEKYVLIACESKGASRVYRHGSGR